MKYIRIRITKNEKLEPSQVRIIKWTVTSIQSSTILVFEQFKRL